MGPLAAVMLPVASLTPKTGPAGSEVVITISQYSADIPIEVRETNGSGALIGMGATGAAGTGSFPVTIPASASGSYLIYICGLCTSQYPEWATRSFLVTGPAPATTTTAAVTTTLAATTTLASVTTIAATTTAATTVGTSTTDTTTPVPPPSGTNSSRALLVGAIAVLAAMLAVIVGILIGSRGSTNRAAQPPPPPPPAS